METVSQPGQQTRFGRGKIDTRHADLGKSELERPPAHLRQQQRTIELTAVEHHAPIVGTPSRQVIWRNEDDTRAFAEGLSAKPALAQAFITLHGELGAGKTTLVRHLLRALGVEGRIKSPTYAVVEPHEARGLAIWHFDFYRFDDPREWEDAGFRDIFAGPGLKLAEWPEKAGAMLPIADLAIDIETQLDESRRVTLTARSARGQELLA
jgi:tRNA threonylcarbamoyladenosine biosynthesis protein TsaE